MLRALRGNLSRNRMMQLSAATLTHDRVRLEPLEERHRAPLLAAAGDDPALFRHMPTIAVMGGYEGWFEGMLRDREAGRLIPFAVIEPGGRAVGNTSFMDIRPYDRAVEIGGTWYAPAAQGTTINPAAKFLLLGHAFACGAERLVLKTDALNARSRAAILKLGATFEGIHRHHMRRADGSWRDTAWYSILREEWPDARAGLEARLAG